MRAAFFFLCALSSGCAPLDAPDPAPLPTMDSLLPGSIGLIAVSRPEGLTVHALKRSGAAAAAGLRPGDRLLRYNGIALGTVRELNRLVLESRPGSVAQVELMREGRVHLLEVPVRELDTTPRA